MAAIEYPLQCGIPFDFGTGFSIAYGLGKNG